MEPTHDSILQTSNKSTNVRSFYKRAPRWITGPFSAGSVVAPEATASLAARLFFSTRRTAPKADQREVFENGERFSVDGLSAWSWGKGPVVLLVHGWNGRASQLAPFVSPLVSRGYQVVAFDAPGHGESPGRRSSLPEIANAIRRVSDAVGPVYGVVAHSMGGAATTIALSEGLVVERAVFISPPSNPEAFVTFFAQAIGISDAVHARVRTKIETTVGRKLPALRADRLAPTMRAPLLVIHDEDDGHVPPQSGQDIADAWPGATFVRTHGLGHQRILRDDYVNQLSVGFIDASRDERAAA